MILKIFGLLNDYGESVGWVEKRNPTKITIHFTQDLDLRYCIVKSNQEICQIRTKGKLDYNIMSA